MFAQVEFKTESGTYYNPFSIELSGNEIYYTLDGTDPTKNSTKYTGSISIDDFGTSTTIKAASFANDKRSEVVTATYELKVAAPTFSEKGGIYEKVEELSLKTETTGATIYYNDRGEDPKSAGSKLFGALSVLSTKTVRAVAFITDAKGNKIYSDISSELYIISPVKLFTSVKQINDGKYAISNNNKVAVPLYKENKNGNLEALNVNSLKNRYIETFEFNSFTFTAIEDGYSIKTAPPYNLFLSVNDEEGFCATKESSIWKIEIDEETLRATISQNGKIIAYDIERNVFSTFAKEDITNEKHELPILYNSIEYPTITITPESGDTLKEFSKVTITCDRGLVYKDSESSYAYYTVGYDYAKKEFNYYKTIDENTVEFSFKRPIKNNEEYKVVIPANLITIDPNGFAQKNKEIIIRYTVINKDILELNIANPANNDTIRNLQYLYFEFNQEITPNIDATTVIKDGKGNEFPLSISKKDAWGENCQDNALCLMTESPITTPGEYQFVLKQSYVCAKDSAELTIQGDLTYIFTVEESLKIEKITPNSEITYKSVNEIVFNFNKLATSNIATIVVTDSESNSYNFNKVTTEEESNSFTFVTETPITTTGTYTFTIADNSFYCENKHSDMNEIESIAETKFTFNVDSVTTIENIEANKEASETYDLAGRRVNEITNAGIYIVNGKKTVVK